MMKWRINILEGFLLYVLWCGECYAYEVEGECDEDDGDFDEVCVHVDNNNIILLVEKYNWLGGFFIVSRFFRRRIVGLLEWNLRILGFCTRFLQ